MIADVDVESVVDDRAIERVGDPVPAVARERALSQPALVAVGRVAVSYTHLTLPTKA